MTPKLQLIFQVVNLVVNFQVNDLGLAWVGTGLEMGHLRDFCDHSIKFRRKTGLPFYSRHLGINLFEESLLIKLVPENRLDNLAAIDSLDVDWEVLVWEVSVRNVVADSSCEALGLRGFSWVIGAWELWVETVVWFEAEHCLIGRDLSKVGPCFDILILT